MREREANRVGQRVLARTVDEVEYYYRESTRLAQSLVDIKLGLKEFTSILALVRQIIFIGS